MQSASTASEVGAGPTQASAPEHSRASRACAWSAGTSIQRSTHAGEGDSGTSAGARPASASVVASPTKGTALHNVTGTGAGGVRIATRMDGARRAERTSAAPVRTTAPEDRSPRSGASRWHPRAVGTRRPHRAAPRAGHHTRDTFGRGRERRRKRRQRPCEVLRRRFRGSIHEAHDRVCQMGTKAMANQRRRRARSEPRVGVQTRSASSAASTVS